MKTSPHEHCAWFTGIGAKWVLFMPVPSREHMDSWAVCIQWLYIAVMCHTNKIPQFGSQMGLWPMRNFIEDHRKMWAALLTKYRPRLAYINTRNPTFNQNVSSSFYPDITCCMHFRSVSVKTSLLFHWNEPQLSLSTLAKLLDFCKLYWPLLTLLRSAN